MMNAEQLASGDLQKVAKIAETEAKIAEIIEAAGKLDAKALREKYSTVLEIKNQEGCTPLLKAISKGKLQAATTLLEAGADVTAVDSEGNTALHFAAYRGLTSLIPILVARGAKLEVKNHLGRTPFLHALTCSQASTALALLNVGADVTAMDKYDNTALHFAAYRGLTSLIPILVARGAKLEVKNQDGKTPLLEALSSRQAFAALVALLEAGADVTAVDSEGNTALHIAAYSGVTALIPILVAKGLKLEVKNQLGNTPLFRALENNKKEAHKFLLIFETVQSCFDVTLLQRVAKYIEISRKLSPLCMNSEQLQKEVQDSWTVFGPKFLKFFSEPIKAAQAILKTHKIEMNIAQIDSLIEETVVELLTVVLSSTSRTTADLWKTCIDVLLFEPYDDKSGSSQSLVKILGKPLSGLVESYVTGDPVCTDASDNPPWLNSLVATLTTSDLSLPLKPLMLERQVLQARLRSCQEYLARRHMGQVSELGPYQVVYFCDGKPLLLRDSKVEAEQRALVFRVSSASPFAAGSEEVYKEVQADLKAKETEKAKGPGQ